MNANVYRQMIADGHTLTAQDAQTLCDEVDALQRVNRILDDAAKDAQHYAYKLQEARDELARLRSAPVAVEVPELTLAEAKERARGTMHPGVAFGWGYDLAVSHIRTIPSDRVLKEGEVAVPADLLREARDNCQASTVESGVSHVVLEYRAELFKRLSDALRSQRAAEGGEK